MTTDNQQRAAEVFGFRRLGDAKRYARDDTERVAAALHAAEARGRDAAREGYLRVADELIQRAAETEALEVSDAYHYAAKAIIAAGEVTR